MSSLMLKGHRKTLQRGRNLARQLRFLELNVLSPGLGCCLQPPANADLSKAAGFLASSFNAGSALILVGLWEVNQWMGTLLTCLSLSACQMNTEDILQTDQMKR